MGSEVIVLSSDDEDANWLAKKPPKRSKIQHLDADLTVIERMPAIEAIIPAKFSLEYLKVTQGKPPQDDDCCIISYDPENYVHVPNFQANDADDLVVVGERGPVACRDFPHARYLCVKFPYATTPHEKHCEQCHCYVCDAIAPCLHWGQGMKSTDHCHAIDKDDKWRKMRTHRFRTTKLSSRPHVTAPIEQAAQPQSRTYTQPPLKVSLTTGLRGSPNFNTNSPSNQGTPNLSSVSANWQPYIPSNRSTMLADGCYGNSLAIGETVRRAGNSCSLLHTTVSRGRVYHENRSPAVNNTTATVASQPGSYQQRPIFIHAPHINTQIGTHSQGATLQSSSIVALQPGAHLPSSADSQSQRFQDTRPGSFSAVPHNYSQNLCATTENISARPSAPPLNNFNKDLATLQSYLMEGISRESPPTAYASNLKDTGHLLLSEDSVPQGQLPTTHNRGVEPLYNPFEPSEGLAPDDAGAKFPAAQTANTQASVQVNDDAGNKPLDIYRSNKNTEQPLTVGDETGNSSLLDHLLAEFDDAELWMLLEPGYPGF